MTAVIKIKYQDELGNLRYIKPWSNFVMDAHSGHGNTFPVIQPASEAIKDWGGRLVTDEESRKTYTDYQIEFATEALLTYWLLKFS